MFSPINHIIKEAKKGKMFMLVDDQNRENEGKTLPSTSRIRWLTSRSNKKFKVVKDKTIE